MPASVPDCVPSGVADRSQWPRDGTASIGSQLKSGYNHAVSAMWQSEKLLHKSMFIYPVFLSADPEMEEPITSLPNQHRRGINKLIPFLETLVAKGLHSILLFGSPPSTDLKDGSGSLADDIRGPILPAIPLIREAFPDLYIVADVSLCEYTDHGHCAVLFKDGTVDNEASVARISDIALSFAQAGVHCVAPSDMSDGRIRAIKLKLISARLESKVAVMSYAAKYASCLYGPFREAAASTPRFGDRKRYLLPPPARGLARKAMTRDLREGADMIMVKPAYPDIISDGKELSEVPVVAMQVSGEFAMVHAAAAAGVFDLKEMAFETSEIIVRAGADAIVSYFTPEFLDWLS
ncbi:delta-aminolevulinic acid dehydratase [Nannizzia gypsea CBS 118893]|uniref:Delta-aminolevulinic acid dehydratase n=1 Tax=Arthroderma gypseum (strain ATCC MYA-4604 / CBS 118893) TaxID=535722 RepID=E4UXV4_ARTGP|nr:delta-aminolevulinic acid dehydratase [Nannizzia gypsea CBS 118893]EFR02786.1 delta-aminolevulinic acid dehydratase [Nannizzia gypsea CBS 118893]